MILKVLAVALVVAFAAFLVAPRLHQFAYWRAALPEEAWRGLATDGWLAVPLDVEPEVRLAGLVRPPQDPNAPWVLFLPGNSRTLLPGFRDALAALRGGTSANPTSPNRTSPIRRSRCDIGLSFWAWRGFDASTGTSSVTACRHDAAAAWHYLTAELHVAPERIHILSYSLGTDAAIHLATQLSVAGTPPASVVLASPYTSIGVMGSGFFDRFLPSHRYDALSQATSLAAAAPPKTLSTPPMPILVVHGDRDEVLPIHGARELAKALGAPLKLLAGAGHADWLGSTEHWELVREWILGAYKG